MSVTVASIRAAFGEVFKDPVLYPDDVVSFWISVATLMLNPTRWGIAGTDPITTAAGPITSKLDLGTLLYVAHNLVLERQNVRATVNGAVPGLNSGAIASESVGPVSASYDTSAGLELDAGHWNLTVYGTRFVRLANMLGTGPLTVNGGWPGWSGTIPQGPAWPGPPGGLFPWWGTG